MNVDVIVVLMFLLTIFFKKKFEASEKTGTKNDHPFAGDDNPTQL